tara:strand:+ start:137 stop:760 length:624 start_codon:yes stop_codon:yes gene_type:complete
MESNNFKKPDAGCDRYGKQRLDLAVYLRDNILNKISNVSFIENGTLLGAWRNGKFIKHDDDFDFAVLINSYDNVNKIFKFIQNNLVDKYQCRLITNYSTKIEILDDSFGKYKLLGPQYKNADFHYVTIDLQFYMKKNNMYESMYYISVKKDIIHEKIIIPTSKIMLENELFNAPNKTEIFLKEIYGSLDINAKYNSKTGFYIAPDKM